MPQMTKRLSSRWSNLVFALPLLACAAGWGCGFGGLPAQGDIQFVRAPVVPLGELRCLVGHDEPVWALAFSPDGRRALSGCGNVGNVNGQTVPVRDHSIRVWDLETGKEVGRLAGHPNMVQAVAYSPDGRRALSGGWDDLVRLWDLDTAKEVRSFQAGGKTVWSLAWFRDGRRAVGACNDGAVRIWDVDSGNVLQAMEPQPRGVHGVALSPDEKFLAAGGAWGVQLWEVATGQLVRSSPPGGGAIRTIRFAPDGRSFLSAADSRPLVLWDANTGAEIRQFRGHQAYEVYGSNFTPDGRRFLSCGGDLTMRLWDATTGTELKCYRGFPDRLNCVVISPDGKRALSGGGGGRPASLDFTIRLWELPAEEPGKK